MSKETVIVLGASPNPDRYAYKALTLLSDYGHTAIPVHPNFEVIESFKCYKTITDAKNENQHIDTLTVYVNPSLSDKMSDEILVLGMKRVIFNPGTENQNLISKLEKSGVEVVLGCTLVMLRTDQF